MGIDPPVRIRRVPLEIGRMVDGPITAENLPLQMFESRVLDVPLNQ